MVRLKRPIFVLSTLFLLSVLLLSCLRPARSVIQDEKSNGEGVLETDDISVILQGGGLWIRITPLEEDVLRYCTDDTRQTYRKMLENQGRSLVKDGETDYKKFLVLFQGRSENEIYFDPTQLNVVSQGNLYKPEKIIPVSSTFDKRVLTLYGNPEMAIYAFSGDIDLDLPMVFQYKDLNSNRWEDIIRTIESSKLRVRE